MKFIKNMWNDTSRINKIELSFLIIILLSCFLLFDHNDLLVTSTHGRILLEDIFSGKFFSFYDIINFSNMVPAVYLIPIYILFAIWSIPVEIIYFIFKIKTWGIDPLSMNYATLMWYKLLEVSFTLLTAFILYKIGKILDINKSKRKWMIYVFLGTPILIFSSFIMGQYDSLNMFFTTLAIYYYLQKKYYKFSLSMAIAIPLKLFPIFIFIPLLLLSKKKIVDLIKFMFIGFSGYIISNLLFIKSPGFIKSTEFSSGMIERFFSKGIPTPFGYVSIFILAFILTCVYCYIKKVKDDKEHYYYTLYIVLFIYSMFFTFVLWHPQWVILLVPIWILTMFTFDNIKTSMILTIFLSIGYILVTLGYFYSNVDTNMIDFGILPAVTGKVVGLQYSVRDLFTFFKDLDLNIFMTLFASCTIVNLIIKYPTEKRINEYKKGFTDKDYIPEKGYILWLILVIFMFIVPAVYMYFR